MHVSKYYNNYYIILIYKCLKPFFLSLVLQKVKKDEQNEVNVQQKDALDAFIKCEVDEEKP